MLSLDQPIPGDTFETALNISFGLSDGEQRIAAHHAHLIISPIAGVNDSDQANRNAIGTLQLAGALAEQAGQGGQVGVTAHYWSSAQVLTDPDGFADARHRAEAAEVARHLFNITGYLLGSGARFNDGDTLGVLATEQFRARNLPAEGEQPPMLALFMEAVQ